MSRLRILIATDQWSPDRVGGSARVAADSARALASRGHEIAVLAPAVAGLAAHASENGVEVFRVLRRHGLPQTIADPIVTRHAARELRGRDFDVAVAHQSTTGAGLAAARLGTPLALVFHASAVLEMRFLRPRVSRARRLALSALEPALVGLERAAVARAAGILVLSSFSRDLLLERHPAAEAKTHTVSGGVDVAFFEEPPEPSHEVRARYRVPEDALLLATARRLEPRMGVEELIRALAQLADERVVLVVAGDGIERDNLTRLSTTLGVSDRVRLVGRIAERELRSLYAAADLFVLPTIAYEGFGMSTVEALASGTPVLGTSVGATPEILAAIDRVLLVDRADPESLAAGVRRVLPTLGPELSARCAAVARTRYAWDAVIGHWEKALRTVARN